MLKGNRLPFQVGFRLPSGGSWSLVEVIARVAIGLSLLAIAVLLGLVSATANLIFFLAVVSLLLGAAVFSLPVSAIVFGLFVAGFVVIGPVIYAAGFSQIQWVPALVSLVLAGKLVLHRFYQFSDRKRGPGRPAFIPMLWGFLFVCVTGAAFDGIELSEFINSSRWYLFFWPLMLVIGSGLLNEGALKRLWQFLIVVLFVQLPFAVYQFLFVARQSRREMTPWDSVVGTFPGGAESGGQSAAMGVFVLVLALLVFGLWRAGKMRWMLMVLAWVTLFGYLALAEVKAVVLFVPVVLVLYFKKEIFQRPIQAVFLVAAAVGFIFLAFSAYQSFYYDRYDTNPKTGPRTALGSIENAISPDNVDKYTQQLGRVTHLVFWWHETAMKGDVQHTLIGHGMGAVHASRIGIGQIASRYPYVMDPSAAVILLWETGLLGLIAYAGVLVLGARESARLANQPGIDDWHKVALRIGSLGLTVIVFTLPYKDLALRATGIVMLEMLMLGQVLFWRAKTALVTTNTQLGDAQT